MKKAIKFIPAVFVLLFVIANILRLFSPKIKTEIINHGEMELSYSFEALVIRDETVIYADYKGVLESMVSENEMVCKSKHVASIYEDAIDEGAKKKLISINKRISEIQSAQTEDAEYNDGYRMESDIDKKISEIRSASENKDVAKLVSTRNELRLLNDRKNVASDDNNSTIQMLDSLFEEKAKYEKNLSKSHQDLLSPASGNYSTKIDGYEKIVTYESAKNLTPDDFKALKETKITQKDIDDSGVVCKIIDSFEWSVAAVVTEQELSNLKTGDTVYLRNHSSATDVPATISYISAPENGRYVICATTDVSCDWARTERFLNIDFIKKKYSGLKVPSSAIRVLDGETGVYTVSDSLVKFKKINILYKDGKYAIVQEDNGLTGGLLLYDEVIVSNEKNIKSGMRIKQ